MWPAAYLPKICSEGDHFAVIGFLKPSENDGGVQAATVGQNDLVDALAARARAQGRTGPQCPPPARTVSPLARLTVQVCEPWQACSRLLPETCSSPQPSRITHSSSEPPAGAGLGGNSPVRVARTVRAATATVQQARRPSNSWARSCTYKPGRTCKEQRHGQQRAVPGAQNAFKADGAPLTVLFSKLLVSKLHALPAQGSKKDASQIFDI